MMQILNQMLKLPLEAFVYAMEMLVKTMQGMQRMTDQSIDAVLGGGAPPPGAPRTDPIRAPGQVSGATMSFSDGALDRSAATTNHATRKEASNMADLDLRGNDAKLMRYFISFTRRDLEAFLAEDTEVITYPTTEGEYQGNVKSDYREEMAANGIERPKKWKDKKYPPAECLHPADPNKFVKLPEDDFEEFVKVKVELLARYERKEGEYDKDQADALKTLASAVKDGKIQVEQ